MVGWSSLTHKVEKEMRRILNLVVLAAPQLIQTHIPPICIHIRNDRDNVFRSSSTGIFPFNGGGLDVQDEQTGVRMC